MWLERHSSLLLSLHHIANLRDLGVSVSCDVRKHWRDVSRDTLGPVKGSTQETRGDLFKQINHVCKACVL